MESERRKNRRVQEQNGAMGFLDEGQKKTFIAQATSFKRATSINISGSPEI